MKELGRKYLSFHRGVLESAGLGETAHFLKKARQNLEYAKFSLDNTEFADELTAFDSVSSKISELNRLIVETRVELDRAEHVLAISATDRDEEKE